MKKVKSWIRIKNSGKKIKKKWIKLAKKYDLDISVQGIDSIPNFCFNDKNNLKYKTFLTQEMLKAGFLCSNIIYVSTAHNKKILERYYSKLDIIFKKIKIYQQNNNIDEFLEGPQCISNFSRLN